MRPAVSLLVLVAVLALAGCSGLVGGADGPGTETVTPAPVPTDEREAGPSGDDRVAPGLTNAELVDPEALVESHGETLRNTSYTRTRRVTRRYENGTLKGQYVSVMRRNDTAIRYWYNRTDRANADRRVDRFAAGGHLYTAVTGANGTTYRSTDTDRENSAALLGVADDTSSLRRVFRTLSVETDRAVRRDGRVLYRIRSTGSPGSQDVLPVRNVTFVGYVTPEGVVTDYRVTYSVERETTVYVEVVTAVEDVGETRVERPSWYDEARNATDVGENTSRPADPSGDGRDESAGSTGRTESTVPDRETVTVTRGPSPGA